MVEKREKNIVIRLRPDEGVFDVLLRPFGKSFGKPFAGRFFQKKPSSEIQLETIQTLRQLLSNEKARILHVLREEKPKSIYHLAKILHRDFKGVRQDVLTLKKFGFVKLKKEVHGKRLSIRPILCIEKLNITLEI